MLATNILQCDSLARLLVLQICTVAILVVQMVHLAIVISTMLVDNMTWSSSIVDKYSCAVFFPNDSFNFISSSINWLIIKYDIERIDGKYDFEFSRRMNVKSVDSTGTSFSSIRTFVTLMNILFVQYVRTVLVIVSSALYSYYGVRYGACYCQSDFGCACLYLMDVCS